MASTIGALIVFACVTFGCVGLVIYLFHKELVISYANIEAKDGQIAILTAEKEQIQVQLDASTGDIAAKDGQLAILTGEMNTIQQEFNQTTVLLQQAYAAITSLQTELQALKGSIQNPMEMAVGA